MPVVAKTQGLIRPRLDSESATAAGMITDTMYLFNIENNFYALNA